MLPAQDQKVIADGVLAILKDEGVCNIQRICRSINNRDFKWCHRKHDKYKEVDQRMDNQFVKQCLDCDYHYRDVYSIVRKLEKVGLIYSDKRIFYDRIDDNGTKRTKGVGRRRDLYRFCFLDPEVYKKKILIETLDGYM